MIISSYVSNILRDQDNWKKQLSPSRWSGTHPLRTVWQSTDRGKYKVVFKNKFRHWEKVILDLVVSQSFRNLKEQVSSLPLSSFSLWPSSPGNVALPASTRPGQRTTCCSLPWTTTLLRSYQMICRYPEGTRTSLQNDFIQPSPAHHSFAVGKILNVLLF